MKPTDRTRRTVGKMNGSGLAVAAVCLPSSEHPPRNRGGEQRESPTQKWCPGAGGRSEPSERQAPRRPRAAREASRPGPPSQCRGVPAAAAAAAPRARALPEGQAPLRGGGRRSRPGAETGDSRASKGSSKPGAGAGSRTADAHGGPQGEGRGPRGQTRTEAHGAGAEARRGPQGQELRHEGQNGRCHSRACP
ncbi:unnamed protein product [Prorocentrum cordatum]|uniref:Uncharacterized protein n=1 Tax=Prorocentrum cordatum TaxID=2364126 RepID=A0ABN9QQ70_9DINO|nr:unnamed protein product [Polarella glacialis]